MNILIAEDFIAFRRILCSLLQQRSEFQVISETSDGLEAVQKAEELRPELVLMDVGLPSLNGIEAARRIRQLSPNSKILFVTQESSAEVVQEALSLGAEGYLLKPDVADELLTAIDTIALGERFVSRRLRLQASNRAEDYANRVHVAASYRDDESLVADFTRFIEAALKVGTPVIVIATNLHRSGILNRLQARGWDIAAATQAGTYISLDANETLSKFMVNDWPDGARLLGMADELITKAAKANTDPDSKVAVCGECAPTLWAQGKCEAAIEVERLWDELVKLYGFDLLCGYVRFHTEIDNPIFERICAEHSDAYYL